MNKRNKSGLTLVELVIAITISVIIMFFIGNFIANSLAEIAESNVESRFQADFVDFNATMNNYRNVFLTGSILVDNTGTGSDILMLTSIDKSAGIIFGVVNKGTMKLEETEESYNAYYDKVIGYRDISASEISELESDPTKIYSYTFFTDKWFDEMKVIDFQLDFYNNETIIDMNLRLNRNYKQGLNGTNINSIEPHNQKSYNLNF